MIAVILDMVVMIFSELPSEPVKTAFPPLRRICRTLLSTRLSGVFRVWVLLFSVSDWVKVFSELL
jgi:hypothetical protein